MARRPAPDAATWLSSTNGHCVPTSIGSLLDMPKQEVADALHAFDPTCLCMDGGVWSSGWMPFLASLGGKVVDGEDAYRPDRHERFEEQERAYRNWERRSCPSWTVAAYYTLAQWLKLHPGTEAIVKIAGHALHVRGGEVVVDTMQHGRKTVNMRARVQGWVEFN